MTFFPKTPARPLIRIDASGLRSSTALNFRDEEIPDLLRVCGILNDHQEKHVVWIEQTELDIYKSHHQKKDTASASSLELLDLLPLELLHDILVRLDINSLLSFRQANTRAQQLVASVNEYCVAVEHAPGVLLALERTRLADRVTLRDFFDLLCDEQCSGCGSLGELVFLPTWKRCCTRCLHMPAFGMVSKAVVYFNLDFKRKVRSALPKLRELGRPQERIPFPKPEKWKPHSAGKRSSGRGEWSIPLSSVQEAWEQQHPKATFDKNKVFRNVLYSHPNAGACVGMPVYNIRSRQVDPRYRCAGCRKIFAANNEYFYCFPPDTRNYWDDWHTETSLLNHLRWCRLAQDLWKLNFEGATSQPSASATDHVA